ncbi:MAG: YihA family ribosome biogenesis GTP-binding protein [Lachnospiraceae bacterium]|nr:YihA family ribosome biogenesis GTP-binding protein [Lachnospiraceae bacterium]
MIIRSVNLETVCGITSRLPENTLPEFAFYGKSNVGKSSLINALINRKAYARTSQEPGKTQTINFYNVNEAFYLVDLPGYGYARVSKELQAKWLKMIEKYLKTSEMLRGVFLLIDMRHEPSANDAAMAELIRACGFEPVFILTKADKLSRNEQAKNLAVIKKKLGLKEDSLVIPFSAVTKDGRDRIRELIERYLD